MKNKKIILITLLIVLIVTLVGCRQADRVSHNISKEADNFNVIRRLTVLNARTDKPMFELVGVFAFELQDNRIIATVKTGPDEYKYEVNFFPEMIIPVKARIDD